MYSFLNLEAFHFGGGTGNLASLEKGLAGVGIGNRVIAVFDNDTAGAIQADEVRKLKLPENFRVLTLPDLKLARRYPTLGPNGALRTDEEEARLVRLKFQESIEGAGGSQSWLQPPFQPANRLKPEPEGTLVASCEDPQG